MRTVRLIVAALSLFTLSIANANFSGTWQGTGEVSHSSGNSGACSSILYQFRHNETTLDVLNGEVHCDDIQYVFDVVTLAIVNNKLFYEDLEIGSITEDAMLIEYKDPIIQLSYSFLKKVDPETQGMYIDYLQQEIADDELTIKGKLHENDS